MKNQRDEDFVSDYVENNKLESLQCPIHISSPELQDTTKWVEYPSTVGRCLFHCGYKVYNENKKPTPENPQQQCAYDEKGDLVDQSHKYAGCRGTENQYEDWYHHTFTDEGGIRKRFRESVFTSLKKRFWKTE